MQWRAATTNKTGRFRKAKRVGTIKSIILKNSRLAIAVLSVALIIAGALLRDWLVLSSESKHTAGQFVFLAGLVALIIVIIRAMRSNKEK